jgi:hypothetical protein
LLQSFEQPGSLNGLSAENVEGWCNDQDPQPPHRKRYRVVIRWRVHDPFLQVLSRAVGFSRTVAVALADLKNFS